MKQDTLEKLKNWASLNNWSVAHPLDEERFWTFVIEAKKNGDISIFEEEFYTVLSEYYGDEDVLREYYMKYCDGIALLSQLPKTL